MADSTYFQPHNKPIHNNNNNPTKFYSHFLYKALLLTIFLVILPIFPSQPPEFINQTLNTRGWEFLHLIFVGIAVSYGLFSRRNDDSEKNNNINNGNHSSKFDNAQSYVSRFLQVSSVFDDEGDGPSRSDGITAVQTWNNQCHRNEPVVVVADNEQAERSGNSRVGEKPLLLPVRSLKSRVIDADSDEIVRESFGFSANSLPRSNSNLSSKRFSTNLEENLNDNLVLPSPIPWRSRSGRMESKETKQEPNRSSSPIEESEFGRSSKAQSSRVSRSDSTISSSKKFPTEAQGKSSEDFVRKKNIYRSPPPPPPPPPPTRPHLIGKSKTMKPIADEVLASQRSFTMPKSVRTSRNNEKYAGDQSPFKTDQKLSRDKVSFIPQPIYMEFPKEEKQETVEKLVVESEGDLETEDEEADEMERDSFVSVPSAVSNNEQSSRSSGSDAAGPDVDKKADEFIAKFREQIRLQRIESIKRSSGQTIRKISR